MRSKRHGLNSASFLLLALAALSGPASAAQQTIPQADDNYFRSAQETLQQRLAQRPNTSRAKNVIIFVGDGMSIPTVTAARIYAGQKQGRDGVSNKLTMETFPYSALSRTYSHDYQVTDSAPSATAMMTGVKTINEVVGVNQHVKFEDCASARGNALLTIFEMAEMAHLATGIVTTTKITDATPASTYAHSPARGWEADSDMKPEARAAGCIDIASQLANWSYGDGFEVILGGGRQKFLPANANDPEYANQRGQRTDGRNLTQEWQRRYNNAAFVWNKTQFDGVDPAKTGHLMGLFDPSDLHFEADRAKDGAGEPSLSEMTAKAIAMLKRNNQGFMLLVEGGRIDHGHHAGNAARALEEAVSFDQAIATAVRETNPADTLIVVTADHSHTLQIVGYPGRNNPILGLVAGADGKPALARDGKPYTTLSYANGPGAAPTGGRADLTSVDTKSIDFLQQSLVPMGGETHGGDDVAIFARGPFAHLFSGVVDENYIFHVMSYASKIPQRAGVK
jgi:alkaline phosphatase